MAEREGFEPSIRFCRILTFQASAFDHSATAPHALVCRAALVRAGHGGKRRVDQVHGRAAPMAGAGRRPALSCWEISDVMRPCRTIIPVPLRRFGLPHRGAARIG
jgi:hypothetical protein